MKKKLLYNFIASLFFALFVFTSNAFADHVVGEKYLSDLAVNVAGEKISGVFSATDFAEDHPGFDRSFPIGLYLNNSAGQRLVLARFDGAEIPLDLDARVIFEFSPELPSLGFDGGLRYQNLAGLNSFSLEYREDGVLKSTEPLGLADVVVSGVSSAGTSSEESSTPTAETPGSNTNETNSPSTTTTEVQGPAVSTNSVIVNWDRPLLKNTVPGSTSGLYYYDIQSKGRLRRAENETVYLNLSKTSSQESTQQSFFTLCSFGPDLGPVFRVSFPDCAGDINLLTSSEVEPGFRYELFVSDQANGSRVINDSELGQGTLSLETVPEPVGGPKIKINRSQATILSGKRYYAIEGLTGEESLAQPLSAYLIPLAGGARIPTGTISQSPVGTAFELPGAAFPTLSDVVLGEYELTLENRSGEEVLRISLPEMTREPAAINQTEGTLGNSEVQLNATQRRIIEEGIVPVNDCGYNISLTDSEKASGVQKGRICGFNDAITLIQRVIEYIFILVLPIMAIVFAYAGYMYLTSGGNSGKREAAKKAILHAVGGVVLILSAWLIVRTIVVSLGASEATTLFLNIRG